MTHLKPPAITQREQLLIDALRAIVTETMDYSPSAAISSDSYLPEVLIAHAQQALRGYGRQVYTEAQQARFDAARAEFVSAEGGGSMSTATSRPTRARKPKAAKPLYPDLPDPGDGSQESRGYFWLSEFFRSAAERQAIRDLMEKNWSSKCSEVPCMALSRSFILMRKNIVEAAQYLAKDGYLPFAHENTTFFVSEVAAA